MISSGSPHVRCTPMRALSTCGAPNEIELPAVDLWVGRCYLTTLGAGCGGPAQLHRRPGERWSSHALERHCVSGARVGLGQVSVLLESFELSDGKSRDVFGNNSELFPALVATALRACSLGVTTKNGGPARGCWCCVLYCVLRVACCVLRVACCCCVVLLFCVVLRCVAVVLRPGWCLIGLYCFGLVL